MVSPSRVAPAREPSEVTRPGKPAAEQDGAGPTGGGLRMQLEQGTFCCTGALWVQVGPVALLGRARCFWVIRGRPSGLLSPPGGGPVCHLHWSKLLSGVLAWPAARDTSSLCHTP